MEVIRNDDKAVLAVTLLVDGAEITFRPKDGRLIETSRMNPPGTNEGSPYFSPKLYAQLKRVAESIYGEGQSRIKAAH
ncbi:MAG: hypothetical protein WC528_04350 [Patescibacteria group bacterium]